MKLKLLSIFVLLLLVSSIAYAQEVKRAVPVTRSAPTGSDFKATVVSTDGSTITNAVFAIYDVDRGRYTGSYYSGGYYYVHAPVEGTFTVEVCAKGYSPQEKTYSSFPSDTQAFALPPRTETTKKIEGYVYEQPPKTAYGYTQQYTGTGTPIANVPLKVREEICETSVDTQNITSDSAGYFSAYVTNNSNVCVDESTKKYSSSCDYFQFDYTKKGALYTTKLYQVAINLPSDVSTTDLKFVVSCASATPIVSQSMYSTFVPEGSHDCNIFVYNMFNADSENLQAVQWGENIVNITLDKKTTEIADKLPDLNNSIKLKKGWNLVPFGAYHEGGTCPSSKYYAFVWDSSVQSYTRTSELQSVSTDFYKKVFSFWVYTPIPCQTPYEGIGYFYGYPATYASFVAANDMSLKSGWNLLFVTNDMLNVSLDKVKGGCSITKSYTWNAEEQKWQAIDTSKSFDSVYVGLAIKVSGDCAFEYGPKPIAEIEGFGYIKTDTSTSSFGRATTVTYNKNATDYQLVYVPMTLEKVKELLSQTSAPKFSLMSLTADGKSYSIYYGSTTSQAYTMWYSSGYLMMTMAYKYYASYSKTNLLNVAKAYLAKYPPTSTIDITLLPSAPEFEGG